MSNECEYCVGGLQADGETLCPCNNATPVTLSYRNYRGEVSERTITPKNIWFGATEWHPEPQWLLTAYDHDKQADRDFSLRDFGAGQ